MNFQLNLLSAKLLKDALGWLMTMFGNLSFGKSKMKI